MNLNPNIVLKSLLFGRGVTQRSLALDVGIHENRISNIIKGYVNPKEDEKKKIARVLDCQVDDIFPQIEQATGTKADVRV